MKNLEKLKKIDVTTVQELAKTYKKHKNVSYAYIFDKYDEC